VRGWAADDRDGFSARYARAQEQRVDRWADDVIEIADDARNDFIEACAAKGEVFLKADMEAIMRSRLRIDTRKWLMSKLFPRRYGDSTKLLHAGHDGGKLSVGVDDPNTLVKRAIELGLEGRLPPALREIAEKMRAKEANGGHNPPQGSGMEGPSPSEGSESDSGGSSGEAPAP
jgi:hypothetical protein